MVKFGTGLTGLRTLSWVGVLLTVLAVGVVTAADTMKAPAPVLRGQDPDSGPLDHRHLALVINQDDPLSQAIGRYYIRARHIPDDQVIRVSFPADRPDLSAKAFRALPSAAR